MGKTRVKNLIFNLAKNTFTMFFVTFVVENCKYCNDNNNDNQTFTRAFGTQKLIGNYC